MEIKMENANIFNDLRKLAEMEDVDDFSRKYFAYFIQQGIRLDTLESMLFLCVDSPTMVKDFFGLLATKQEWSQYELVHHCAKAVECTGAFDENESLKELIDEETTKIFGMLTGLSAREFAYWVAAYTTVTRGVPCKNEAENAEDTAGALALIVKHGLGM